MPQKSFFLAFLVFFHINTTYNNNVYLHHVMNGWNNDKYSGPLKPLVKGADAATPPRRPE